MIARLAGKRCARAAAVVVLAGGLAACVGPAVVAPPPREVLLERFRSGDVRLDCTRCRYDFRGAEWLLEDGHYEPLVLGILRSGDGSGRSWYLLGRVAEATATPELAILYYRESLSTPRQPIIALWPLYEDVNYRLRRLMSDAPAKDAPTVRAPSGPLETVNVESLVVGTRPGSVGAFMAKLHRGQSVEVLDHSGDWEQVRLADGRVGWVWDAYTSAPHEPTASRRDAATRPASKRVAKPAQPVATPRKRVASPPSPSSPRKQAEAAAPGAGEPPALLARPVESTTPAPKLASTPSGPRRVDTRRSAAASLLVAAGTAGILGCPLPQGAALSGRSHGSAGSDDHPTETYAIEAPAQEIVGFYEREMERAGWHKTQVSSEFLLYFVKDDETVGVLIEREGGLFTLMGS